MVSKRHFFLCLAILGFASATYADREISASVYRDRLEGMWIGQLLGNYAGRQVEGYSTIYYEGSTYIPGGKPVTDYQVQWSTIIQGQYYNTDGVLCGSTTYWSGDDDTCLEFLYAHSLQNQSSLNVTERTSLWTNNLSSSGLYIANKQAWYQINTHGRSTDESGSVRYNMHAGWAIDSQITTETLGALAVGMRQQSANLAGDFGGITNSGYSLHAAQFYAAMYADAPFTSDVEILVDRGLEVVPTGSWTREIITKAQQLYTVDKTDDGQLNDWLDSRNEIIAFAHQRGRERIFVESPSNTGLTTLAILYGQGSFKDTVEFGVRGGEDSDCNPATAGGLVGMMKGQTAVLDELITAGLTPALPQNYYDSSTVIGLPHDIWTTTEVMDIFQTAAETQIIAGGGSISDPGAGTQYFLPDSDTGWDNVVTGDVSDPVVPVGLVGEVLGMGGQVDVVVTQNGLVVSNNSANDRTDQGRLIDGVSDLTNNGVLPFRTYDGGTDPQTDGYELHFDQDIVFEKLILHEGDISDSNINRDPSDYEPYGGYFQEGTLLTVEVQQDGAWVGVANLALSEALVNLEYFQTIELTFDEIEGQSIRVVGSAGGQRPYTSLTEIEAYGVVIAGLLEGDANRDGVVSAGDYASVQANFGNEGVPGIPGDANGDSVVSAGDYASVQGNFGNVAPATTPTPEPATLLLLAGGSVLLRRRRK